MKRDMDKIILESRREVSILQNTIEKAYASKDSKDEERELAKELSALLDEMYYS